MKLNISFPTTGCQKLIEVDDERKLRTFYEKRMTAEVSADALGEEVCVTVFGGVSFCKWASSMIEGTPLVPSEKLKLLLFAGLCCPH
uniref:Small ribosomal subunit protein eS6 n=1 Tax=Laticauda laticaudata TaxID=8630 RepID=A0A8C5SIB5_LATLA